MTSLALIINLMLAFFHWQFLLLVWEGVDPKDPILPAGIISLCTLLADSFA